MRSDPTDGGYEEDIMTRRSGSGECKYDTNTDKSVDIEDQSNGSVRSGCTHLGAEDGHQAGSALYTPVHPLLGAHQL